eukprot:SAG31_NODE_6462_length_2007_cov_3.042977_3_plen_271_part_01
MLACCLSNQLAGMTSRFCRRALRRRWSSSSARPLFSDQLPSAEAVRLMNWSADAAEAARVDCSNIRSSKTHKLDWIVVQQLSNRARHSTERILNAQNVRTTAESLTLVQQSLSTQRARLFLSISPTPLDQRWAGSCTGHTMGLTQAIRRNISWRFKATVWQVSPGCAQSREQLRAIASNQRIAKVWLQGRARVQVSAQGVARAQASLCLCETALRLSESVACTAKTGSATCRRHRREALRGRGRELNLVHKLGDRRSRARARAPPPRRAGG